MIKALMIVPDGSNSGSVDIVSDADYSIKLGSPLPAPFVEGSIPEKVVTVTPVNFEPIFRVPLVNITVVETQTFKLWTNVISEPEGVFQWQKDSGAGFVNVGTSGPAETHDHLTVNTVALASDGDIYRLAVTTLVHGTTFSNTMTLTVSPLSAQTTASLPSATLSINEEGDPVLLIDVTIAGGAGGSFEARTQGITAGHTVNYTGFSGVVHNITAGQTTEQLSIPIIDTDFGVGNTLTFNLFIENFVGLFQGAITQAVVTIDGSAATSNTQPTTSGIGNVSVTENAADTLIDLFAAFADVEDPDNALVYTVQSNTNSALFTSTNIAGQNLTLDYAATGTGSADITVRATDTGGLFVEATFTVTVAAAGSGVSHTSNGTGQSVGKTIDSGGLVIAGDVLFFESGGVTQLPANTTGIHEAGVDLAGTAFASTFKLTQQIAATLTVAGIARAAGKLLYNSANNNWINWELIQTAGGTGRMRLNAVTNGVPGNNHDLSVTTQAALTDYTFNVTSGDIEVYVTSVPGSKAVLPAGERPPSLGSKHYMLTAADYVDAQWGDYSFAAADVLPMTITRNVSGSWAEGTTFSASVTVANYVGDPFLVAATMTAATNGFYPFTGAANKNVMVNGNGVFNFAGWPSTDDGTDHSADPNGTAVLTIDDGQP